MAEFCLDCFNEMNGTHYTKGEVWLEDDLCEGCGEIKPCVIDLKPKPLLLRLLSHPKKWLCVLLAFILIVSIFVIRNKGERECVLCDSFRYHAPVLIDLEKGSCIELDLYLPHETKAAELAEVQPKGETFSLISLGNVSGYRDKTQRKIEIKIPAEQTEEAALCRNCRFLLSDNNSRYILADLYAEKAILPILANSEIVLRCYKISMSQDAENGSILVIVQGILEE